VDDNNFGDYVLFPWDTFFCSLLAARRDKDLAYDNVRAVLAEATDRGMLPNVAGGAGKTLDRSQPPVGAYCVWKLYKQFGDLDFLAEVYPQLRAWHAFWMVYRDGNGDGLLEWGSDPIPAPVDWWKPHTQQAAKWESGLDNSPMYEDIAFNDAANTLELADVGLSCLYAADAEALADMAEALGKAAEAEAYRAEFHQIAKRINEDLWDEENGIYCNRHWDGRLSERWSPTSFYPLYAGVATPERAERCVREHLMNPDEFWGKWAIPSISRKDPNFPVQKYWQGRVWPPMNFLCYEGLRRYGFHAEADELAEKSAALFLNEWRDEGHIHENYNAITGDGDDVNPDDPEGSSDPIYTWGGLLAYIALDAKERVQP
jgi:putative isomerase